MNEQGNGGKPKISSLLDKLESYLSCHNFDAYDEEMRSFTESTVRRLATIAKRHPESYPLLKALIGEDEGVQPSLPIDKDIEDIDYPEEILGDDAPPIEDELLEGEEEE
ncbi:hypothetical protein JXA12_02200 [Candidatus Woesearchaeota archaeon]|nr:hypothetical protein [Candidatus Woesearchaeota archaeon]